MKQLTILGIFALVVLLALPGAVSAADVTVSGSVVDEDLTVTAISPNVGVGAAFFANEPNVISVTVTNNGGLDAAASTVEVVVGTDTYTAAVPAIADGGSAIVTVTDTVSRPYASGPVSVTATADSTGVIAESDEGNNAMTSDLTIYNNGYKGKRYTPELGGDLTTQVSFDGRYDVIYSAGNTVYKGHPWTEETFSWTTADLPIPAGATVVNARLYQAYTYNQMGVDPAFTMSFNGATVTPVATYMDIKGFGSYSFPYGLYVYDVTSGFDTAGNSMTITPEAGENYGIYGAYLIVTYSDPATTEKQIYINDEFDMVYSRTSYSINDDEATAYATFTGVDAIDVDNAQAIAILAAADETGNSKFYFNDQEYTGFWADYLSSPQLGFSVYDVTSDLSSGANEAGLQSVNPSTKGDNIYAMNAILVVEKTEPAPEVTFIGTPLSGTDPLTVTFDATNTGGLVSSWSWEYSADSGSTWTEFATDEDPTYTFNEGVYDIRVTATGSGGTDTAIESSYISVGEATITISVSPESIDFGNMAAGETVSDSTGVTVTVDGGTAWSVTASATNGGYMMDDTTPLVNLFQLSNDGTNFQDMDLDFSDFLTGSAGSGDDGTAYAQQLIDAADAPGSYSITLTFTGGFA